VRLRDLWRRWGRADEERAERGEEGGLALPDEPITGDFLGDQEREAVLPVEGEEPSPPR